MPKKIKKPSQSEPRPDLIISEDEFIAQTRRPALDGNRRKFVVDGFARGLSLETLLRGSGFTAKQLFEILRLDEIAERKTFERLTEIQDKRLKP